MRWSVPVFVCAAEVLDRQRQLKWKLWPKQCRGVSLARDQGNKLRAALTVKASEAKPLKRYIISAWFLCSWISLETVLKVQWARTNNFHPHLFAIACTLKKKKNHLNWIKWVFWFNVRPLLVLNPFFSFVYFSHFTNLTATAKSLQEFAAVLQNLEDERTRMVSYLQIWTKLVSI